MKKQAETLDSKEGRQNIFRIAKQKKKERKDITGTKCLKGDNGELLVSEEQVSGRWREYFKKLQNEENEWNDELSAECVEVPADMISKEVRQAIQDIKVRKAAGPSGVTAEMIKAAGEQAVDWLTSICNRIVKEEAIPESWQMSELVPIYKGKGDVLECSSSRGIKLLEHGMKVAERVLERRLRQAVEIDKIQFKGIETLQVDDDGMKSRPKKIWREVLREDMREKGLCREDAWDRSRWRKMLWEGYRRG